MMTTDIQYSTVAKAVEEGLAQTPKRLPSWLFYDEAGDKIFQAIMRMPEYYLTRCEYEILQANKNDLLRHFSDGDSSFNLVELGAGDGLKTEILLEHFTKHEVSFSYLPVDVSETVLDQLKSRLEKSVPGLALSPVHATYEDALETFAHDKEQKAILFLGANIGNFKPDDAIRFIRRISLSMQKNDVLLVGFDLKKDPRLIQAAYDDPHGITRSFNLNLLARLNRELGAQFQLDRFKHYPYYDPESGITKSYLVSNHDQDVYIESLDQTFHFDWGEIIHTEVSQKYDTQMIETLAFKAGLEIVEYYYDCKHYFCDVLFRKR